MRITLEILLVVGAIFLLTTGAWFFAKSRLPSWMTGIWKWPLGDNLTGTVVHLVGWASVLVAAACVPTVVVLALWDRSTATYLAGMSSMFLAGAGSFGLIWSVVLSRSKPVSV
jgi:Na+(H+)/acetate symporter ActP